MDNARAFEDDRMGHDIDTAETGVEDARLDIATDERRMHVQAYNHWVSLLHERPCPSLADLDPANISDFGPYSVLLDFSHGVENPAIAFLGRALREECQLDFSVTHISQVPSRSLLSRLTDHYLQIIANRAPIGFEAEFVSTRGQNTLYRGILMPFSSDGAQIDFIYGVINWKELVDAATQAKLDNEVDAAVRTSPKLVVAAPAWADGPSAPIETDIGDEIDASGHHGHGIEDHDIYGDDIYGGDIDDDDDDDDDELGVPGHNRGGPRLDLVATASRSVGSLTDQLTLAQQTAAAVRAADTRTRTTLYRALARAHDFAAAADADPAAYEALLNEAGITLQLRAPMTPIVKLVFGADYDKTRLTEYAAVLSYARRIGVATGALNEFLEGFEGGIKGVVRAERAAKLGGAPVARPDNLAAIADKPVLAEVQIDTGLTPGDYVVLLARVVDGGTLDVVAAIGDDTPLTQRVMRQAVAP